MQRPDFMPINTKTTKADLVKYAKRLEKTVEAYREGWYDGITVQYFGVAPYGWGSWEEDVFFCEARTPKEALELAEQAFRKGHWDPSTWDWEEEDRDNPLAGRVFVYNIVEIGTFEKIAQVIEWTKTG